MSSLTAYNALRNWFEGAWTAVAVRFENETAYAPAGVGGALPPFVYMEVTGGLFAQLSIGAGGPQANLWRESGSATFFVCVKTNSGVSYARGLAQTLAFMMRGLALSPGLQCTSMRLAPGEPFKGDGNYFAVPLITDWYRNVSP